MAVEEMPARMLRLREEISLLLEAGDPFSAYDKCMALRALYDTTPDREVGGNAMKWRDLEALTARIEKLKQEKSRGVGGIQQQRIEYRNPSCY